MMAAPNHTWFLRETLRRTQELLVRIREDVAGASQTFKLDEHLDAIEEALRLTAISESLRVAEPTAPGSAATAEDIQIVIFGDLTKGVKGGPLLRIVVHNGTELVLTAPAAAVIGVAGKAACDAWFLGAAFQMEGPDEG